MKAQRIKNRIFDLLFCVFICTAGIVVHSCKKSVGGGTIDPTDTTTITPPNDPPFAATVGFFGNDWKAKTFSAPSAVAATPPSGAATATVVVDMSDVLTKVSKYIFGNNSNLWMGQIANELPLAGYIADLSPNVLRAPAGSVSDVYFFNQSTAPPADVPDSLYDSNGDKIKAGFWYGGNTGSWTCSIDNYYQLLQQTNSTGIITVNYAYARYGTSADPVAAAAHLAADWVRYDNGRSRFWEIGNESGGVWEASYKIDVTKNKDGQPAIISGDLYGRHVKVFADSMRAAALSIGKTIYIGAQLADAAPAAWQDTTDQNWDKGVLSEAGSFVDFFIVHDYFTPYNTNSPAADIFTSATTVPASAMNYLKQQMSQYGVSAKPIALTEWNIFATGSKQMVSNIAGVHAVITLGELIKNQFGEASRWDLANGWSNGNDQGMFNNSAGDAEPGASPWNPRPAFYYMYYFQKYFGDRMVASSVSGSSDILSYASSYSSGESCIAVINKGTGTQTVNINMKNFRPGTNCYWVTLTGGNDGDFSGKVYVNGTGPAGNTGGPLNYASIKANSAAAGSSILVSAPSYSVTFVIVENKK